MNDNEMRDGANNDEMDSTMDDFMGMLLQRALSDAREDGQASSEGTDTPMLLASTGDVSKAVTNIIGRELAAGITKDRLHKKAVVDWVISHPDEISGGSAEWHNLVNSFYDCEDFNGAIRIAKAGLERYPHDATLLGDAIRSAGKIGDWAEGNRLVQKANDPDYRSGEDWSLAVYLKEYMKERARSEDHAARIETYNEALAFLQEAETRLPMNDRLINSEAEILIESGRTEDARNLLEDAIFMDDYKGDSLNPHRYPVPQCCLTYIDEILPNSCDYDKIIDICNAGIRFAAQEKKSVSVGYFFYRKALAMDGQIIANGTGARAQGIGNQDYVRNALRNYSLASKLTEISSYKQMCRERFIILCALGGIDDMDVDEYVTVD